MVPNKKADQTRKRRYTLKARARRQEEVHRRITEAAVHFHGTVGPARTTVSDIARRAGVRRATVYNHFPTDLELIDACSSHWFSRHPPPDPAPWTEMADPVRRVDAALREMYDYYDAGQDMLANVLRDAGQVPALEEIMRQKWEPLLEGIVDILAAGWEVSGDEQRPNDTEMRASLRVVLDFFTWQTLADAGLANDEAARLATAWVVVGSRLPR